RRPAVSPAKGIHELPPFVVASTVPFCPTTKPCAESTNEAATTPAVNPEPDVCERQIVPLFVVPNTVPLSPTIHPKFVFANWILFRFFEVATTELVHVLPPSIVLRTVPDWPTTQPTSGVRKRTEFSGLVVCELSDRQVIPPSV